MAESEISSVVSVKILETHGNSVLVQYIDDGMPYRCYVDVADIVDGECPVERLQDVPYGIDWGAHLVLDGKTIARQIELELKRAKIWTYEDLQNRDRALIRISNVLGRLVWDAAKKGCKHSNT